MLLYRSFMLITWGDLPSIYQAMECRWKLKFLQNSQKDKVLQSFILSCQQSLTVQSVQNTDIGQGHINNPMLALPFGKSTFPLQHKMQEASYIAVRIHAGHLRSGISD